MGTYVFDALSVISFFSPPFLLASARTKLFSRSDAPPLGRWKAILGWVPVLSITTLLIACIVMFSTYQCNADQGDWSCVIRWENFTRIVVRATPVFLILKALELCVVSVLAIAFDCILIEMMR
jgi:hypothetical protein